MLSILGNLDTTEAVTELRFSDGRIVRLATTLLNAEETTMPVAEASAPQDTVLVPVLEEQLEIAKRTVLTGKVRLEKSVEAYDVTVDEPLAVTSWKVERIPLGQVVHAAPSVRQEGLITVYPILEERMVLTKELVLIEEIRVTRETSERQDPQTFTLRREHLDLEREEVATN